MPRLFFPFPMGATVPAVVVPPPPPPFWTKLSADGLNWNAVAGRRMPRFEHVYPQEGGGDQAFKKVNLDDEGAP